MRRFGICRATLLLLALLFHAACRKEQTDFYLPAEFKAWSCYRTGSYWVYLNEKTGAHDCVWISRDTTYMQLGYRDEDRDPIQYFEIFSNTVSGGLYTGFYTAASGNSRTTLQLFPNYLSSLSYSVSELEKPEFRRNIHQNQMENKGVAQVYPKLTVNGNEFQNVYEIRHEWFCPLYPDYGDSLIAGVCLAGNIGIVRLRKYKEGADTTWSLLRWNVIR